MEKKRVVTYGDAGKNRATVTEEELDAKSMENHYGQTLLRQAGNHCKPLGTTYVGSACVHYYSREVLASQPDFFVVCQTSGMGSVVEHHADLGWKQLGAALMRMFGKEPPKTRGV